MVAMDLKIAETEEIAVRVDFAEQEMDIAAFELWQQASRAALAGEEEDGR